MRADRTKKERPGRARAYNHGDLRAALLRAVAELVAERGVEGLTLRKIARRASVSHGAPSRHSRHLQDLLTEYAPESFELLPATMDQENRKDKHRLARRHRSRVYAIRNRESG